MLKLYSGYLDTADLRFAGQIAAARRIPVAQVVREAMREGLRLLEARRVASGHIVEETPDAVA